MDLRAVEVAAFKRLEKIEILTPELTVLVGGNNSGKSSLLQGIHFWHNEEDFALEASSYRGVVELRHRVVAATNASPEAMVPCTAWATRCKPSAKGYTGCGS